MIILLAIALSVDALGIGVSYALRKIKVPFTAKAIICAISILITAISITIGRYIGTIFTPGIAKYIGAMLMLLMGICIIYQGFKKENKKDIKIKQNDTVANIIIKSLGITIKVIRNPLSCDFDKSSRLDPFEAIYMGIALSIDSFGVGIGSSVAGFNSFYIPLTVGLFQMLFLYFGNILGGKLLMFEKISSKLWITISGILLIIISLFRIL